MGKNIKISLTGDLGSGKSTVAKIICQKTGAESYSTGTIQREMATKRGMTTYELNAYSETHPEIDNEIDGAVKQLEYDEKPLIVDSRMAWHFVPSSFSVYLIVDINEAAKRIMNANRQTELYANEGEAVEKLRYRRNSEKKRYSAMYGVDICDYKNYDLVVDTTHISPNEVAQYILSSYEKWQNGDNYYPIWLTAKLLCPTKTMGDDGCTKSYTDTVSWFNPVKVASYGEKFYIVSGHCKVVAHIKDNVTLIGCEFADGSVDIAKLVERSSNT